MGCDLSSSVYATKGVGPKQPQTPSSTDNRDLWERILVSFLSRAFVDLFAADSGGLPQSTLAVLATTPFLLMSLSVKQRNPALFVGAFVALVHLIASDPEKVDPDELGLDGRELFKHAIMVRVTAMREEKYKLGEDEQLFWCYWALDGYLQQADETNSGARYALTAILNVSHPVSAWCSRRHSF